MSASNDRPRLSLPRRRFLQAACAGVAVAGLPANAAEPAVPKTSAAETPAAEQFVAELYATLSAEQRGKVAFDWDHTEPRRGLLRTRIAANWRVTEPPIHSDFYTPAQKRLVRAIFAALVAPDWLARFDKQLGDDDAGFGTRQTLAIFGRPPQRPFQFVLTGRHMTVRCDGGSAGAMAFGGPIFYGHAASGFNEKPDHPGNVFWHQALAANGVYKLLDGKQQQAALVKRAPAENAVGFRAGGRPGIAVATLGPDQKKALAAVLDSLVEPYRPSDRAKVRACLDARGGLDACHLAFFEEGDLGADRVWDVWRLEGPAFVWHFRGTPHVHTWVHVADDPSVKLNA